MSTAFPERLDCADSRDGSITVSAQNGSDLTYRWNDGETGRFRNELPAGLYVVTVTDGTGCARVDSVTITAPAPITLACAAVDSVATGEATGRISLTVGGGTGSYDVSYTGPKSDTLRGLSTTGSITDLPAGEYVIVVTDDGNCAGGSTCTTTIRESTKAAPPRSRRWTLR